MKCSMTLLYASCCVDSKAAPFGTVPAVTSTPFVSSLKPPPIYNLVEPSYTQEVEKSGLVGIYREELLWVGDCEMLTDLKLPCWSRPVIPMLLL